MRIAVRRLILDNDIAQPSAVEGEGVLQCSGLYTTHRTGSLCLLRTVCAPVARSILSSGMVSCLSGLVRSHATTCALRYLAVQPCREGFILARAEADIQHRCAVLEGLNQCGLFSAIDNLVKVDILVPGRDEKPVWRVGGENERRDGVVRWLRHLELGRCAPPLAQGHWIPNCWCKCLLTWRHCGNVLFVQEGADEREQLFGVSEGDGGLRRDGGAESFDLNKKSSYCSCCKCKCDRSYHRVGGGRGACKQAFGKILPRLTANISMQQLMNWIPRSAHPTLGTAGGRRHTSARTS